MTFQNRKAVYACINYQENYCPPEIKKQTLCIQEDIGKVIMDLLSEENCI